MAKTNLEHEFDILNKFNQLRKNLSSYKKDFFQSLISLGPVSCSEERVNKNFVKFFEVLNSIKSLNPSEKDILKTYLQKILQELDTPEQQRIFLDQLHPKIKRFGLSELSSIGIDPEQMLSSEIHYEVTNQAFELEPTRIIAFNKLDASNQEVLTSLKIAYAKHKDEHVLITCSAKDLQTFGAKCKTLVLIGHGSFYREGESSHGKIITRRDVEQARKGNTLGLGPYHGTIDSLVSHLSYDLKCMPNLKHCRILMCRAGAADESISSKQLELYEKKHKNDPESASIMQVWDSKDPTSLPYDENTLASAFWHKLFISPEKWMTEDTDFALTVASSVIVPEVSRPKYSEGFFKVHDPENLKHENQLLASKYITVVTPASSKLQERLVEHNHYLPVK